MTVSGGDRREHAPAAEHLETVNAHVQKRRVVVDEAENLLRAGVARRDLLGQRGAEIAGAVEQHVLLDSRRPFPSDLRGFGPEHQFVAEQARQRSKRRQRQQADAPVEQDDRARKDNEPDGDRVVRRDEERAERQRLASNVSSGIPVCRQKHR